MTQQILGQPPQSRSRRRTGPSGLPHLAKQLPPDFRSPSAVNGFIYSLAVEVTAGRVESRTAAILGYISQLALQTLPLLREERIQASGGVDMEGHALALRFISRMEEDPSDLQQADQTPNGMPR